MQKSKGSRSKIVKNRFFTGKTGYAHTRGRRTRTRVARVWSIGAFDQMRCTIDQFVISAAFYQLRNS